MSAFIDISNKVFGDYSVVEISDKYYDKRMIWEIKCNTCGYSKLNRVSDIISGRCTKCFICAKNKAVGLNMKQIKEIEVLYIIDCLSAKEIAERYNINRCIVYRLKKRFEWGDYKKPNVKRSNYNRPFIK
jgi:hypothetical protein